ncbi:UNVERIFIED_CONTAM: hypothetical protein Sradi_3488200 [Sesamum radiatum]|uniref:Uncharacterized protein n=1 Tax=Sesamum radiatum TaxID=300843 RepID=A0AAW2QEC7_SESRA
MEVSIRPPTSEESKIPQNIYSTWLQRDKSNSSGAHHRFIAAIGAAAGAPSASASSPKPPAGPIGAAGEGKDI